MKKLIPALAVTALASAALLGYGAVKNGLINVSRGFDVPDETIEIDGDTYRMTFCDDFDGKKLDTRKWSLCPQWERGNVGGHWSDDCVSLDGAGRLVLKTKLAEDGTPLTGAIRSKGKFEQSHGYFEARCRLQSAHGMWTAFWLMCEEEHKIGNGAKDGAEIDIYESYSLDDAAINHAVHWDGYGEEHRCWAKAKSGTSCYDGKFHTFGLLWTDDAYIFYIDGREVRRLDASDAEYPGCCEPATYLKLSVEAGTWAGAIRPEELPDDSLTVDYVKVYQKTEN